eukprot:1158333-Pelagomonas_calceolata.AAC.11
MGPRCHDASRTSSNSPIVSSHQADKWSTGCSFDMKIRGKARAAAADAATSGLAKQALSCYTLGYSGAGLPLWP